MPELPDITLYIAQLQPRIAGQPLNQIVVRSPFLLRSVDPPLSAAQGKRVTGLRRLGKRIVLELEDELFLIIHLMIAGRFRWVAADAKGGGKLLLASFHFPNGTLQLTEAGSKRRASLHRVAGAERLREFERGGLEVLEADLGSFA